MGRLRSWRPLSVRLSTGPHSFVKPQLTSLKREGIRGTNCSLALCKTNNERAGGNTRKRPTQRTPTLAEVCSRNTYEKEK